MGQRGDSERGNVIAAAQALYVMRRALVPLADVRVAGTLRYLAHEGLRHAAPVEAGGRGEFTRYVTFALEGLVEFPEARGSRDIRAAIDAHAAWLLERQIAGGWGEAPDSSRRRSRPRAP